MPRLWSRAASPTRCALRWRSSRKSFALPATRTYYRSSCLETIRASRLAGSCLPMARALQTDRDLCPRVLLRRGRGVSGPVPRCRARDEDTPVEPEGVRAAECRTWDCGGGCRSRSLMTVASAGMTYRSINDLNNVADALHFTSKALSDRAASSISLISPIDCSEKVASYPHNRPYEKLGRDRRPYAVSKLTSRSRKEHLASVGQRYTGVAATIMEDRCCQ